MREMRRGGESAIPFDSPASKYHLSGPSLSWMGTVRLFLIVSLHSVKAAVL